ncbi:ATP-binding protein [Streptomyces sp. NPDC047990]|uniref:ATP-binding protein n=1 Tax=Streptomyces sp. NPDC047990 TaxID=3365496 RepID=UPI00371F83E2
MDNSSASAGSTAKLTLKASLVLDADGPRVAHVRHLVATFLTTVAAGGIAVAADTVQIVQLIVSELVTNARKHAPGPARLHLRVAGPVLRVEIHDTNPVAPTAKAPDPTRVGQHGLEIVTAPARTVTVEQTPDGKRITAHIVLHPATA